MLGLVGYEWRIAELDADAFRHVVLGGRAWPDRPFLEWLRFEVARVMPARVTAGPIVKKLPSNLRVRGGSSSKGSNWLRSNAMSFVCEAGRGVVWV